MGSECLVFKLRMTWTSSELGKDSEAAYIDILGSSGDHDRVVKEDESGRVP